MAQAIQQVFELKKKLRELQDWAKQADRRELLSERAIANTIGLNRSTLKSNIQNERMSLANQEALADSFGFNVAWPEWHDFEAARVRPSDRRRDTAAAFLERFLASKSRTVCPTIESGLTEKYLDRRFADFSLSVAGSFVPHSQADGIPLVLKLSFDRRGWPILLDGEVLTVGLKQADIQLFHSRKNAAIEVFDIECLSEAEGNFRGKVEGLSPWWIVSVNGTNDLWLMGRRLRNDGKDCVFRGFHIGDKVKVQMTARVNDCFVRVPSEAIEGMSTAKTRFIEHLHKLAALNGTEAVLGEQILTVVDRS
jgi:hypothetical protein